MYKDKFVLSVLRQGSPVKETGRRGNKQAAIPFGSEYKLRLKNKNDRSCAVRLSIDGSPVSSFGDFIVGSGATVDLERFVTDSMNQGKKFKFVTLDHKDVDDPTKSENGIIRAEFRLAQAPNGIKINPTNPPWSPNVKPWPAWPDGDWWYHDTGDVLPGTNTNDTVGATGEVNPDRSSIYSNSNSSAPQKRSKMKRSNDNVSYTASFCSMDTVGASAAPSTQAGATIEGSSSGQSFAHVNLDVESRATIIQLKIVGVKQQSANRTEGRFCTQCGGRLRRYDKYCAGCGRRV